MGLGPGWMYVHCWWKYLWGQSRIRFLCLK